MHVFKWLLRGTERMEQILFSNVGRKVSGPLVGGIGRACKLHEFSAEGNPDAFWKVRGFLFGYP
jgi:hypothetical protein